MQSTDGRNSKLAVPADSLALVGSVENYCPKLLFMVCILCPVGDE